MGKVNEQAVIQLIIKGEQSKTTVKEVRTAMIGLERQLVNMKKADDPAGFEKLRKELNLTKQAHQQMITEIRGGEGALKNFSLSWKDIAGGVVGGNIAVNIINKIVQSIPALISTAGELSDELADVQKQTGITGDELLALNDDLKSIDTRTPIEELRKLAAVAGKLGYTTRDEVLAFVEAADKLNVSLGEDLGGNVEEAINDIGKLVEIFGLKEEFGIEQSMLKVGSAINTVGASSAANEGYLVQWAKRFAGIAPNAGISIGDTLGMAAAADILGQTSEQSASNIGKMIIALGKDIPYFAKVAKMSVKDFSTLLKTDGNEAFLRVLEGAKSSTKGVEGLSKMLETLGISGSEGAAVLGAFAKNTELVRQQQDIANKSFADGTSIINEFNVKNQNSAAILEKVKKVMAGWWESAAAGAGPLIQLFGKWFGVVDELDVQMGELSTQQNKVIQAETRLPSLIKRYDDLKAKSKLTKDEQVELNKVMKDITDIVPTAAFEFDKYGNVMQVNTGVAKDFITEQKTLLETMRQTCIEMLSETSQGLKARANELQRNLNNGFKVSRVNIGMGQYQTQKRSLEASEIKNMQAELAKVQNDITVKKTQLDRLNGIFNETAETGKKDTGKPGNDTGGAGLSHDALKKATEDHERLNDELLKNQQQLTLAMMGEQEKELQATVYKYDALREKAKGNSKALAEIAEQQGAETDQIYNKYNKKYLDDYGKTMRGQLIRLNDASKAKNEFEKQQQEKALELEGGERAKIEQKYAELLALAELNGYDRVQIEYNLAQELNKLQQEQAAKEIELFGKTEEEKLKLADKTKKIKEKAFHDEIENIGRVADTARYGADAISAILELTASNQEQNAEFQKTMAIFQIAISSGEAIAAAVAAATKGGDPYTIAIRVAAAVASVATGILKAKKVISEAKEPSAPAFRADGGSTDLSSIMNDTSGNPQGWVNRPTLFSLGKRSYVAGEAGREYVISQPMLQHPVVADFANTLESLRTDRFFAGGGSTALAGRSSGPSMDPQLQETNELLRMLINKNTGINYDAFERFKKQVDDIRFRASA